MDFPLNLTNNPHWVYDKEEVRQVIISLLKDNRGSFIQSPVLGRKFDVHQSDKLLVDEGVRQTLEQIKGMAVKDVSVNLPEIKIMVDYNGDNISIEYQIEK